MALKTVIENNNRAVGCAKYSPRKSIPECGLIQEAEARANKTRSVPVTQVHPAPPPAELSVGLYGQSHICDKCGNDVMFVMSAGFNSLSGQSGQQQFYNFVSDGPRYSRSMLDRILASSRFEIPSRPGCETSGELVIGVLVRTQGRYQVQCPNCQELRPIETNDESCLCVGRIDSGAYKRIFGV